MKIPTDELKGIYLQEEKNLSSEWTPFTLTQPVKDLTLKHGTQLKGVFSDEQKLKEFSKQIDKLKNQEKELSKKETELKEKHKNIKREYSKNNAPIQQELKNIDTEFQKEFLWEKYPTMAYILGRNRNNKDEWEQFKNDVEANHIAIRVKLTEEFSAIQDPSLKYFLLDNIYSRCTDLFNPHSNPNYCRTYDRDSVEKLRNAVDTETKVESTKTGTGHYYGSYLHLTSLQYITYSGDENTRLQNLYTSLWMKYCWKSDFLIFLPTLDSDLQQAQGKFLEGNKTSFDGVFEQVKTVFPQYEKERLQIEEEQTKTSQMLKDIKEEKDILEDEKNNLEEEINFIRLLSPENQEIVRKLKEQWANIPFLKRLFIIHSDLDLSVFNIEEGVEFLKKCTQFRLRPCLDGKNFIGVKIEDADSIDTWAGLQYGTNVSIWCQGELYGTQYHKYRDGYNYNRDEPRNDFSHVNDILIDKEGWIITVVAQAWSSSPQVLYFDANFLKSLASGKEKEETPEKKEQIKKAKANFTSKSQELIELCTRKATAPLHYNMKYCGDVPAGIDPFREVPYEEAKIIDKAFDTSLLTGVIVLSAQIDANALSGKQMEYVAYIIDKEGNAEQCWRDCIYADALSAGKSINIPQAISILEAVRNGHTIEEMSSHYEALDEKAKKSSKNKSNSKIRSSGFCYIDKKIVSEEDAYKVLGLPVDTSFTLVKKICRKLFPKLHPDQNPNNPDATRNFQKLREAYEFLENTAKNNVNLH